MLVNEVNVKSKHFCLCDAFLPVCLPFLIFFLSILSISVVSLSPFSLCPPLWKISVVLQFFLFLLSLVFSLIFFQSPVIVLSSPPRTSEEREDPAADFVLSKCYFISFISASFYPQRRSRMLVRGRWWKHFDRQAKLPAVPVPPGPFSFPWNHGIHKFSIN